MTSFTVAEAAVKTKTACKNMYIISMRVRLLILLDRCDGTCQKLFDNICIYSLKGTWIKTKAQAYNFYAKNKHINFLFCTCFLSFISNDRGCDEIFSSKSSSAQTKLLNLWILTSSLAHDKQPVKFSICKKLQDSETKWNMSRSVSSSTTMYSPSNLTKYSCIQRY